MKIGLNLAEKATKVVFPLLESDLLGYLAVAKQYSITKRKNSHFSGQPLYGQLI